MVNERINRLITVLGMHPTSFSASIGVNVTVIFNIVKGRRSKPSFDLLCKILNTYDNLSAEWLLRGEGVMWNDDIVTSQQIAPAQINLQNRIRELFIKLRVSIPDAYEVHELEELVGHLMEEITENKQQLILLHERQESMLSTLKDRFKLKI